MITTSIPRSPVDERLARARAAQAAWAARSVRERLRPVRALRPLLVAECDALCAAVARDVGKTSEETIGGDILPVASAARFLEREAGRLLRPRRVPRSLRPLWLWGQADTVYRRPRGVVGIIGTWNYPLLLNGVQMLQALTAGNAVLWKPSEVAETSAALLHDLLLRAGYPPDLVQRLDATRENGRALTEADVDHVVFTGGVAVGQSIAASLAPRFVTSTLELSGCDAQFVLDDADVKLAARAAWFGATVNHGQTCIAVRRAFVHRSLYSAFCDTLRELASGARPLSLALRSQAEQAERLLREALAEGGRLLAEVPAAATTTGGRDVTPAVVIDARPEMALCREASFAPVMAVLSFDALEQALEMERQCPFALAASVFTRSPEHANGLAARLRAGAVTVNDVVVPTAHPATPFGGRGSSGWGTTQGAEGLLEMTVPQAVSVRTDTFRPHYDMAGGQGAAGQGELLRGLLESGHAATFGQRCHGWGRLFKALWRGNKSAKPGVGKA
jgi:acyl-CoA reductase-like NAD-dependent aldehyde dehydrogenase